MKRVITFCAAALLAACGGETGGGAGPQGAHASAEPAAMTGARAFAPCATCHVVADPQTPEGRVKLVGPNLFGVVGRPAGALDSFVYSTAMSESGIVWDEASLDAFIANPQQVVPRTRMAYAGLADAERRAAIIEYLKENGPAD